MKRVDNLGKTRKTKNKKKVVVEIKNTTTKTISYHQTYKKM